MPSGIEPMLALLAEHLPADPQHYAFEYKWDGVRLICYADRGRLRLVTRNQIDSTHRYPELQAMADALSDHRVVLDGEVVALDDVDRPSFSRLQQRMHRNDPAAIRRLVRDVPVYLVLFDVIWLDGRSLMPLPYAERRQILEELALVGPNWQRTPAVVGEGKAMLDSAKQHGLEGIVAKRLDGGYEPGRRSSAWLKIKLVRRQEFVIGGWLPETTGRDRIGALLLGYFEPPDEPGEPGERAKFRFVGKVGSGLVSAAQQQQLKPLLARHARDTSPFDSKLPNYAGPRFVEPELVAEVEFRGITDSGMLRQPAFKGLRTDKAACEVIRE